MSVVPSATQVNNLPTDSKQDITNEEKSAQEEVTSVFDLGNTTSRRLSCFEFKGLMAPVFTCFKDDENRSLNVKYINRYAEYLKENKVKGVLVNGVTGEGPVLGVKERKAHCEYWYRAAIKYELLMMLQVGGAPLPDVLDLAAHAEQTGVHAVCCLPELFYKPRNADQLVGYCRIVANKCKSVPFFYYHVPLFTGVDINMAEFCAKAEVHIPNFYGINYTSTDLEIGYKCLREGRVVMLGTSSLLASGLMCGFESLIAATINVRPDLVNDIIKAFESHDMDEAKKKQDELNRLTELHTHHTHMETWVVSLKVWFNKEMSGKENGFSTGPARRLW